MKNFFFGNYEGIWTKTKKIHNSSKNGLALTGKPLNDIFLHKVAYLEGVRKVLLLGNSRSRILTLDALNQ
jgi:hypothetical protein